MPTFDIVSKLDHHEIDNAVDQAKREVVTRFDFKDTGTEIDKTDEGITIRSNGEGRLEAALRVIEEKMVKRKVSLKALDPGKPAPAGGQKWKQVIALREGVATEKAKEIVRLIKDSKLKVQASIQGDVVRVTGKKRDDLQAVMSLLREQDMPLPLQFVNFRE